MAEPGERKSCREDCHEESSAFQSRDTVQGVPNKIGVRRINTLTSPPPLSSVLSGSRLIKSNQRQNRGPTEGVH